MSQPVSRRRKILMVDDDAIQREVVRAWLESVGHEVITLDSPFGASRVVLRERPDVVLLDIEMPGLDGQLLAESLRKNDRGHALSIIYYSGKSPARLQTLAHRHGALGAISKTTDGGAFLGELRRLLDARK